MTAQILDGAALAARTLEEVAADVATGVADGLRPPLIATVLVGDDHASLTYVRMKVRRAERAGMRTRFLQLSGSTTTEELVADLRGLSADPDVDGILLQHPVPDHVDERAAFEAIPVDKDVDGVTWGSFGRMAFSGGGFGCATPTGILRLLDAYEVALPGTEAVVVGQGPILGKPLSALLTARGATVTSCHRLTRGLRAHVERADLLCVAVGVPDLVPGEWIKPGAVVVDAGYSEGGRGDVDAAGAAERASWLTPVPGGVGPMTIAVLLDQTRQAWRAHTGSSRIRG